MIKRRESFDAVTKKRLPILQALQNRELDNGEVALTVCMNRAAVFWHLQILKRAGLISEICTRKLNVSPKAKRVYREIVRFALTLEGQEAINYFENKRVL